MKRYQVIQFANFGVLVIFILLFGATMSGTAVAQSATATATPSTAPDSFTLIEQDLAGGVINVNTATLYKVYALFKSPLLPIQYQSNVPIPRDATGALIGTLAVWNQLNVATQQVITDFLGAKQTPATTPGFSRGVIIVSCSMFGSQSTQHFTIWYALPGQPCSGSTTPDYVGYVATGLEDAWTKYSNLGYQVPASYNVYIVPVNALASGITSPQAIFIRNDVDSSASLYLQALSAHEFFHAVQWQYFGAPTVCPWTGPFPAAWTSNEDVRWWMEATAQWAQHEVYANDKSCFYAIGTYLNQPWRHMDYRPLNGADFTYGTVLFPIYLTEHLAVGSTIIKTTWEKYSQLNMGVVS